MKYLLLKILTILSSIQTFAQFSISDNLERLSSIKSVEFLNKNIFVVTSSNIVLFSKDGGKSFKKNDFISNSQILNDSTFINCQSNSMIISYDNGITSVKNPYIDNNGDTIKFVYVPYLSYIFQNGRGFIHSYLNNKPKLFYTENWGNTWAEADSARLNFSDLIPGVNPTAIKCNLEKTIYSMRKYSDTVLFQYFNYGDSTMEINLKSKGILNNVIDMAFKDENNGIFLTKDKTLYITNDGCQSFRIINDLKDSLKESIEYAKPTKTKVGFYILALKNGGTIYSKDDGKTWFKNLDNNNLFSMNFYDAETGIVTIGRNADNSTNIFYFTDLVNGIKEQSNLAPIGIFPNPATNTLNLNISEDFSYSITNLQGQVMQHEAIKNVTNSLDISKLPIGVYIINVTTETRNYYSKFIKTE